MTALHATEVGRQVAFSGLLPSTASYLLEYLSLRGNELSALVPGGEQHPGDAMQLNYCLLNACLTAPEFSSNNRTRTIPYGFDETVQNERVERYASLLAEPTWQAYRSAANAATLLIDWSDGVPMNLLEGQLPGVRAGTIKGLCRDVSWVLSGLANILAAATKPTISVQERPLCLRAFSRPALSELRKLLAPIRRLQWRLDVGLPSAVLWMTRLKTATGERAVGRQEAFSLHQVGLGSFESLRRRSNWNTLVEILTADGVSNPHERAKEIQQLANNWHTTVRERHLQQQIDRVDEADRHLIEEFYRSRGKEFEVAFQNLLKRVGIEYKLFDADQKAGAFDYLLQFDERPDVVVECKTKQGKELVDLTAARVVLASSEQYGYRDNFCVTLCQPGVDPNVPENLESIARLCVVETHDLAEAFTRLMKDSMSLQSFHDWLTQPGQARMDTLMVHTRSAIEPETPGGEPI
ncbi:DEAD/DEAH box helicase [Archangium primigenium]|uniref:DEAD/DEAH box helicase n=1 Tax=[Archangium] primigenium TaxID=2792470 RepID=UPI00195C7275|nr:DEAD/DEAH box helicase [Archangium primigenium]MBM7113532.1 DEAD/DEAH box helicase [Archangium primigenium]